MIWAGGRVRQAGFVVDDLRTSIDEWLSVGVGPFFVIDRQPLVDFVFRGEAASTTFAVALAHSGGIQIELIQPLEGPSAFAEFREQRGTGLQHVAWWTDDFDAATADALAAGLTPVQSGRSGSGGPYERFAYFEHPASDAPMVEISEVRGRKATLFAEVERAAASWDGTDPVRDMAGLVR